MYVCVSIPCLQLYRHISVTYNVRGGIVYYCIDIFLLLIMLEEVLSTIYRHIPVTYNVRGGFVDYCIAIFLLLIMLEEFFVFKL